jgi:hypothetical protein
MENYELNQLLTKNGLDFQWSDTMSTWMLSDQGIEGKTMAKVERQHAVNIGAAQAAAISFIQNLHPSQAAYPSDSAELEDLLSKHRLTFNWGNPGLRWWLVGQQKGTNTLLRTTPQNAKDVNAAKTDAIQYIRDKFEK